MKRSWLNTLPVLVILCASCGGSSTASTYPVVGISAPAAAATVTLPANKQVSLTYSVTNFTVKAPGTCGSVSATCGHVHILIDGSACNDAVNGSPYNNTSVATPTAVADFSKCPTSVQTGSHTVTLELHDDQHGAVKDATGAQVKNTVTFTTN